MRAKLKNAALGTACILCTAALVTTTTLLVVNHNANSTGKGGLETSSRTDLPLSAEQLASSVESSFIPFEEGEIIADDTEDHVLSYFSYRIKDGDMISVLAQKFDVTTDTIVSVNSITNTRTIHAGEYLRIPSMAGILYTVKKDGETSGTIAQKYGVDAEKCALANNLEPDAPLTTGRTVFVPDARMDSFQLAEINGDLFKLPLKAKTKFYYSSWYGWRQSPFDASRRTFHSGIDMACAAWTKIYPALPGTVTYVGQNDPTFGNYVVVTHPNGYKTLYGHMIQKPSVEVKQKVGYDTILGYVGSTGLSTGNHLHFTVYKNGKTVNPANLLRL